MTKPPQMTSAAFEAQLRRAAAMAPVLPGTAPTPGRLRQAERLAAQARVDLPAECRTDWQKCLEFVLRMKGEALA